MTDETDDTLLRAVAKSPAVPIAQPFSGNDRFEIVRCIGRGGMGVVHEAIDKKRNSRVALKTIDYLDGDRIYRLKKEFRALAGLSHENLVSLHELFSDAEHWFFTMELIDGVDLLSYLASNKSKLREVFRQLALGLVAIHQGGKLHRDLKPPNVLITECGRVVILDFGLSTESAGRPEERSTVDGTIRGTVSYMSPEHVAGTSLSPASDWYSFGVMLYQVLTGRMPHTGSMVEVLLTKQSEDPKAPQEIAEDAPDDLGVLCMELLRRDPGERPSAGEVLRRLGEAPRALDPTATGDVFVGRERELGMLRGAFEETCSGHAVTVCIEGTSGLGKSTLIERFVDQLRDGDDRIVVLRGRCHEQESVSFRAFDGLVDSLSVHLRKLPPERAIALIPREAGAMARLFPVLNRVDAIRDAPSRVKALDPHEAKKRGVNAFREIFGRMTDRSPVVLVLDDLQWGDLDSALLLTDILQKPEAPPMLVLAAYRTEGGHSPFVATFHKEGVRSLESEPKRIQLTPLSAEVAQQLASKLLEPTESRDFDEKIAKESGGNPFFISEMVRYLGHERAGSDPMARSELSVDEMIMERVSRLPQRAQSLLRVIALASRPVTEHVAARAAEVEPNPATITMLRSAHLIRSAAGSEDLETYHDRIRETLVGHLGSEQTQALHLNLAAALEASDEEVDPEALAIHLEGAGKQEAAALQYVRAADRAAEALVSDRASALYRRAIGLGACFDDQARRGLRAKLARALADAGRGGEAALEYLKAAENAPREHALVWKRQAADQYLRGGHLNEGFSLLGEVLPNFGLRLPNRAGQISAVLWERARLLLRSTHFRERPAGHAPAVLVERLDVCISTIIGLGWTDLGLSAYFISRAYALALEVGDPYRYAIALGAQAILTLNRERRAKLLDEARDIAERLQDPYLLGSCAYKAGLIDLFLNQRFCSARKNLEAAEGIFGELPGTGRELSIAQMAILDTLSLLGDFEALCRRVPEYVRDAKRRGDLFLLHNATVGPPARFYWLVRDEPDELRRIVEAHKGYGSGRFVDHYGPVVALATVDLYEGRPDEALRRLEEAWPRLGGALQKRTSTRTNLELLRGTAACAVASSATGAERARLLRVAERSARAAERGKWLGREVGLTLRSSIAWLRGDADRASALCQQMESACEALDLRFAAVVSCRARGYAMGGDEGAALIREADAWMTERGVKNPSRFSAAFGGAVWSEKQAGRPSRD